MLLTYPINLLSVLIDMCSAVLNFFWGEDGELQMDKDGEPKRTTNRGRFNKMVENKPLARRILVSLAPHDQARTRYGASRCDPNSDLVPICPTPLPFPPPDGRGVGLRQERRGGTFQARNTNPSPYPVSCTLAPLPPVLNPTSGLTLNPNLTSLSPTPNRAILLTSSEPLLPLVG